jgi:hypothetical protein
MIFRKYRDVSPSPPTLTYSIITITLTVILVSSPVITAFSPLPLPIVLKVEFASASSSSSSENDGGGDEESNTDATTTDDTEGQHQQVPPPQPHQQVPGTTTSPHNGDGSGTTTAPLIPDDDSTETPSTGTTTIDETPAGSEDTPSDATSPQSPTDTSSQQGGQQGQGQQSGTIAPAIARTNTFAGGISITKDSNNGIVTASIPGSEVGIPNGKVTIHFGPNGGVEEIEHPHVVLGRTSDGSGYAQLPNGQSLTLRPDGIGEIDLEEGDTTITGNRDSTLTISKRTYGPNTGASTDITRTTYTPP